MSDEQFSLIWNSFPRDLSSGLYTLLTDEQLVDVTLAAEGQILRAHKLVLSVCSTYFRELFKGNSCKHPIVILKDVNYRDLSAMLRFMYQGEVNIKQEDIASFLKVAEMLRIKGLTTEINEASTEETASKNAEFANLFNTEKDRADSSASDTNTCAFDKLEQCINEDQQLQKQSISLDATPERAMPEWSMDKDQLQKQSVSLNRISERSVNEFSENVTTNLPCLQNAISDADYSAQNMHAIFDTRCRSTEPQNSREEPLDCRADVNYMHEIKHEPLDYTVDMGTEIQHKSYVKEKLLHKPEESTHRQDFVPDTQLVPDNQNAQSQSFGLDNVVPALQTDLTCNTVGQHPRGRRTVKGIPNSSLPLETTLRVVSELGPTLRMERGKVIRMYSCPWCLRHFTRKENLKLHVRYIHGPLESLTCKLCGNKYKNSNSLRVHSYLYHNVKRDKHAKPLVIDGV